MSETTDTPAMPTHTTVAVLYDSPFFEAKPLGWCELGQNEEWSSTFIADRLLRNSTRARIPAGMDLTDVVVQLGGAPIVFVGVTDPDAAGPPEGFEQTPHAEMVLLGSKAALEVRTILRAI